MVRPALTAALLAAAAPALACTGQVDAEAGALDSRWRETGGDGRALLREQGTLGLVAVTAAGRGCTRGDWRLRADSADGTRDYDGRTTSGVPLVTRSDLRVHGVEAQWLPWAGDGWAVGPRLRWQHTARTIRSTPLAAGYPERHWQWQAALVASAHGQGSGAFAGWQWQLEVAAGGGPEGRVTVDLPGYDAARLASGRSRLWQARVQLGRAIGKAGQWLVAVERADERIAAGSPTALTRQGLLVGGVSQPATRVTSARLTAGFSWTLGR